MSRRPLITFTSDFGQRDYYVAAVKGVILSICPQARVIDISHQVAPHDLLEAAFVVASAYRTFPPETVHLVVVDPEVGSHRRGIVAHDGTYSFVAPDNGVLSLIFRNCEDFRAAAIEAERYFRRPVSPTFHGRDIFGPVAAQLARGVGIEEMGREIDDYLLLDLPPARREAGRLEGFVLHIDTFGNVITSLSPADIRTQLGEDRPPAGFEFNGQKIRRHYTFYAQAQKDEIFSLVGSSGYFELAALEQPAAQLLEARRGAKVQLILY